MKLEKYIWDKETNIILPYIEAKMEYGSLLKKAFEVVELFIVKGIDRGINVYMLLDSNMKLFAGPLSTKEYKSGEPFIKDKKMFLY